MPAIPYFWLPLGKLTYDGITNAAVTRPNVRPAVLHITSNRAE